MGEEKSLIRNLKKFGKRISEKYALEKIIFFGSRARGEFSKDSDVDLMVVSKRFEGVSALKRACDLYLEWDLDYAVDFLCYTPEEFERLKKRISIVREAVQTGIEI